MIRMRDKNPNKVKKKKKVVEKAVEVSSIASEAVKKPKK